MKIETIFRLLAQEGLNFNHGIRYKKILDIINRSESKPV